MGGNVEDIRLMLRKHGRGLFVHRNIPAPGEKPSPFRVNVRAGNQTAARIGGNCPGVGAGFLAERVILKKTGDTPKAYNRGFNAFHHLPY
jgi:hypothetical protein